MGGVFNNKMKDCCVYKITNIKNNKVYIGTTISYNKRIYNHFLKLKNKNHDNKSLQDDYNLFGVHNFKVEILESNFLEDKRVEKENYWLSKYNNCYNIANPDIHIKNLATEETKYKCSKSNSKLKEDQLIIALEKLIDDKTLSVPIAIKDLNITIDQFHHTVTQGTNNRLLSEYSLKLINKYKSCNNLLRCNKRFNEAELQNILKKLIENKKLTIKDALESTTISKDVFYNTVKRQSSNQNWISQKTKELIYFYNNRR